MYELYLFRCYAARGVNRGLSTKRLELAKDCYSRHRKIVYVSFFPCFEENFSLEYFEEIYRFEREREREERARDTAKSRLVVLFWKLLGDFGEVAGADFGKASADEVAGIRGDELFARKRTQ